jgi:NADH-quinone oxidoreductase subunit G
MPSVIIDGREVEVEAGTNLIEAAKKVGVQIPHYCYHPRLSIVGQCRMCLVKLEGVPKLQTACTTQVTRDGMEVYVDDPDVQAAQEGVMEFLLINHPLDCPICDQAGECGLQDYSFKHGQAFSRFVFEEKRTYPGRERIPLGPSVVLNMNRCIQCTRCIRFTEEISGTGELGFFQRGARTEIGVFPGRELDNPLSACVVDVCPVGALTSSEFRFAERVWYLEKRPSICTGCDAGCNITVEHRRGAIKRYKPRTNPEVNDYWMCDYGRGTFRRYSELERLGSPAMRGAGDDLRAASWDAALDRVHQALAQAGEGAELAFLGSGFLTTEEAHLIAALADAADSPHRSVWNEEGPERRIPNLQGGIVGTETSPNRRGAEMAGLVVGEQGITAAELMEGDAATRCDFLLVADGDPGSAVHDPDVVARLRWARFLVVMGWADTPLAAVADVVLPTATHAEREGTFVNSQQRLQRFRAAFPAPAGVRSGFEVLLDLLGRLGPGWRGLSTAQVFERMAKSVPAFAGLTFDGLPAYGASLAAPAGPPDADSPSEDTHP